MSEHIGAEVLSIVRQLALELHPEWDRAEVGLDSALDRDFGIDSLGRVELLTRIEQAFDTSLPEDTFAVIATPQDLLKALVRESGEPTSVEVPDRLPDAREREARVRLPTRAETLVEVLHWHARHHPDRAHIRFYTDRGDGEVITYGQLMTEALAVGNGLQAIGFEPGDRALIMLPTGRDYFLSFFGILMAGGIPVPIYPPARRGQLEDHLRRQGAIVENCRPSTLVTVPEARKLARLLMARVETLRWIHTVGELQALDGRYANAWPGSSDTGFIQYTSGSTGNPKGVVLSHANLMANIRADGDIARLRSGGMFRGPGLSAARSWSPDRCHRAGHVSRRWTGGACDGA
jgi:acyl carrier protein